jgi:hypothetical protein
VARERLPRRGLSPGSDRPLAWGWEFARLGAGGEFCEPGQEVAQAVNRQEDQRPRSSVGGDPFGHRRTQAADDEPKSLAETEWGGRGLHGPVIRLNSSPLSR